MDHVFGDEINDDKYAYLCEELDDLREVNETLQARHQRELAAKDRIIAAKDKEIEALQGEFRRAKLHDLDARLKRHLAFLAYRRLGGSLETYEQMTLRQLRNLVFHSPQLPLPGVEKDERRSNLFS